jgi:hypothetical protein
MDGDDAIKAVAQMADVRVGRGVAMGQVSVNTATINTPATVAVTFPVGMFTVAPIAQLTILHTNTNQMFPPTVVTGTLTAAGMTISACRSGGTAATPVMWTAQSLT